MPPVLGIAGHSGAGKTTLIEALLPRLGARGWRVGVLKHDAHRLELDRDGKDTARFYAAGAAAICAHDGTQSFVRSRSAGPIPLDDALAGLPADLDLVLVEGHKDAPIPRLVLAHPEPRPEILGPEVLATLAFGPERLGEAEILATSFLERAWHERPLGIALFVGGRSLRMGAHKSMLALGDGSLLEHLLAALAPLGRPIVLVGNGPVPRRVRQQVPTLPDAPEAEGPFAGLLALVRHAPTWSWLTVGCDQPAFGPEHARALVGARRPGAWAVLPRLAGRDRPEPFGAIVEPQLRAQLERAAARRPWALHQLFAHVPVVTLSPSPELERGWRNANTPEQWRELTGQELRELGDQDGPRGIEGPATRD
jgi:molybdopterin-guanine dinucleotide biosynthesis protein MobB